MDRLKEYLLASGADIVGYADLTQLASDCRSNFPYGISIGKALNTEIVRQIPSNTAIEAYGEAYDQLNDSLDTLCLLTGKFIEDQGYHALPQTTMYVREQNPGRAQLPHKTVAALAGLGWISKSSLLITPQFGSAIRITSVLTDMPLKTTHYKYWCQCGACKQ